MGEYASYKGQEIKIGTCEDMYYLRFDQRHMVQALPGNVDPVADVSALRFRFPWPNEDGIDPGSDAFHANGFHRAVCVHGFHAPDVEHSSVQFVAQAGYNVCLPCPESSAYASPVKGGFGALTLTGTTIGVHRNGFRGSVLLVAQKWIAGIGLVPILMCGGCGSMWREQDRVRIEKLARSARASADRAQEEPGGFWHTVADRILAGVDRKAS
jgi:hypothetical protein